MTNNYFLSLAEEARSHIIKHCHLEWPHNLGGACGAASYHLMKLANKNNIWPLFVNGEFLTIAGHYYGHCWIEYHGIIYDITATQFNSLRKKYPEIHSDFVNSRHYIADNKTSNPEIAFNSLKKWTYYCHNLERYTL